MCSLCHLADPENVVLEARHWRAKRNLRPYKGVNPHLVVFARQYVASVTELTDEMKVEYFDLVAWAIREFDIPGCGVLMRLGDSAYHGGSVPGHLHGHIMVPDGTVPVERIFYQERT